MDIKRPGHPAVNSDPTALLKSTAAAASDAAADAAEVALSDEPRRASAGPHGRDSYSVALSPKAKEAKEARAKAYEIAMATPPVREDRVMELQERIKNGTYKIDPAQIADGMLREAIKDKLATGSGADL